MSREHRYGRRILGGGRRDLRFRRWCSLLRFRCRIVVRVVFSFRYTWGRGYILDSLFHLEYARRCRCLQDFLLDHVAQWIAAM